MESETSAEMTNAETSQTQDAPQDETMQELAPVDAEGPAGETGDDTSTLTIDSDVVEKIVAITCRSVDGILQMKGNFISSIQEGFGGTDITKGVQVEMVGDDACVVSVSIIMEYGKSAKKIFDELHDRITEKIGDMTGLRVEAVNVRVVDVMTREEVEGRTRSSRQAEHGKGRADHQVDEPDESEPEPEVGPGDVAEAAQDEERA